MLLSPGHSPRHLSSPSPSPSPSLFTTTTTSSKNSDTHNSQKVLDEDAYVAAIEKIVERDFFPDIPKLRDRLAWLEALRTRDPLLIRDAQLQIIQRRRSRHVDSTTTTTSQHGKSQTPTPGSTFFDGTSTPTAHGLLNNNNNENLQEGVSDYPQKYHSDVDPSLTLDGFFRRYTSEDNDSFSKNLDKVNRKRKERYAYLLEGEKGEEALNLIEDHGSKMGRITDGYGSSDQPVSTLEGWKYTAKNLLMYHPSDRGEAPLTPEEKVERLKGFTKEISKSNTRFHYKMLDSRLKDEDAMDVIYTPVAGGTPVPMSLADRNGDKWKKYDLEDLKKTPNQFYVESGKMAENGYSFVKTPSPAPGVDESPFITWGEIEGTPLRLDLEDTPFDIGGSGDGPQFKMPMPPSRDVKAHDLSREAARKLGERSKMFRKPPLPSPVRGGSASPSARMLSPAAQKFVRNAIARSSRNVDESLRASYRGASPGASTPKSGRSMSRFGRDGSLRSRSPSVREGSNPPW